MTRRPRHLRRLHQTRLAPLATTGGPVRAGRRTTDHVRHDRCTDARPWWPQTPFSAHPTQLPHVACDVPWTECPTDTFPLGYVFAGRLTMLLDSCKLDS